MAARSYVIRLDIATNIYEQLEAHAAKEDIGVGTLVRRIIIEWTHENPPPPSEPDNV